MYGWQIWTWWTGSAPPPFVELVFIGSILMMKNTATLRVQQLSMDNRKKKTTIMIKRRILVILDNNLMILAVNDSIHRGSIVKSCKAICY